MQSKATLHKAWRVIQENAQTSTSLDVREEVDKFAADPQKNINQLSGQLSAGSFRFPEAKGIPVAKKNADGTKSAKFRPLVLASLRSRIVQRAVLEALDTVSGLKPYFHNPHSFGGIQKQKDGLAAVPAAVQAVLTAIGNGATHVAFADIRAFFTKIPKPHVTEIIATVTGDPEFMALFADAIKLELSNMAELKEKAQAFPIESIGVAQGNSLSPLLGNILLHDFDRQMNEGDCVCIRYIDDFIILAPSAAAAKARMKLAIGILAKFGMTLSEEKSTTEPLRVSDQFDWLGIEFNNGLLRPSKKAISKLELNVQKRFNESAKGMRETKPGGPIARKHSLVATLNRTDSIIRGWGKHYRFCNDEALFARIDAKMARLVGAFLGEYRDIKNRRDAKDAASLLGIDELARQKRQPLIWPSQGKKPQAGYTLPSASITAAPLPITGAIWDEIIAEALTADVADPDAPRWE
ncbi:reverse transcriptase domain-containing protein [Aureimonas phyllosphaerae]|uniref:reverse transcriptase domain-containing protein n=1 Tax=Aureimonas phyllosphaerae TaxID=1166078 RepID=UPI001AED95E4